jgi:hypothetical protein
VSVFPQFFKVGELIGRRLQRIIEDSGKSPDHIANDIGFDSRKNPIEEFWKYARQIESQFEYICQNVDDYNRVWNGTMRDYYFALTKFIQSIPKETKSK